MCDEPAEDELMEEPNAKRPSVLTIDRAAFLLLRVKRAFKKKRQQRKDKNAAVAAAAEALCGSKTRSIREGPPPLLRSRTLPAIVVPGLSILQAQIDPARNNDVSPSQLLGRGVSARVCGLRAQTPRISFSGDDGQDVRRKSASSRLGHSPRASIASDHRPDGAALRLSCSKLTRLLTQGQRSGPDGTADGPRRLSWERRESGAQLPRSSSIDSMVEAALSSRRSEPAPMTLTTPAARADRALSLVSPAVGRRAKAQRGQAGCSSQQRLQHII